MSWRMLTRRVEPIIYLWDMNQLHNNSRKKKELYIYVKHLSTQVVPLIYLRIMLTY